MYTPIRIGACANSIAYTLCGSFLNKLTSKDQLYLYILLTGTLRAVVVMRSRSADSLLSTRGAAATATRGTRLRKLRALVLTELVKVRPQVFLLDRAPG